MNVYLHHYPASLFSEKVRLLLGHLGVPWKSVEIPNIMPRPLLMPLSGGYRKTPCLQIGANVYCDTAVIARGLVRHTKDTGLFEHGFVAHRVAEWADTQLFRITVALNFAPEAVGAMLADLSPEQIGAFAKDRAALTGGEPIQGIPAAAARAYLLGYLHELEASLTEPFLLGTSPGIADFSLYHCLWFLDNNAVNAPLLDRFARVRGWMARMAAIGHGSFESASGEQALAEAKSVEPVAPEVDTRLPEGFALGESVRVTPIDYGKIPVEGTLVACSEDEIVLERTAPEVGRVMTHFPSPGFEISRI